VGADNFRYDPRCDLDLRRGGNYPNGYYNAYSNAYYLRLFGTPFAWSNSYYLEKTADITKSVVASYADLQAQRQIFVPPTGGYARYLETLTNPTDHDITLNVQPEGYLGTYSSTHVAVAPSETGNTYAVTDNINPTGESGEGGCAK